MTLTRLLEINHRLLDCEESLGLAFAERLWRECGSPTQPAALSRALEGILQACCREGVRYPPVLLRRRKELQRGAWAPKPPARAAVTPPLPAAQPASSRAAAPWQQPAGGTSLVPVDCRVCGNKGIVLDPGGDTGRVCVCWPQRLAGKSPRDLQQQGCYTRKP